ncbi:MAG: mandelate racemase/muconate lactonizing enzyme family protein [Chloroflexi bacterium]|nr:mandelate racemase/muconate lactonizing enzyme family protein [Chloroflexota bacterium]
MKIADLTWESYVWPRPKPLWSTKYMLTSTGFTLVKVHTDEGLIGLGIGLPGLPGKQMVERFKPKVVGQDPFDVERIWSDVWVPRQIGRRGMETRVLSAIDIGIWDLLGKITGQPLYRLLGGYAERVPAYVAGGYYHEGKGLRELAQEAEDSLRIGAKAVKIKIGGAPVEEDVERVRVVRETIGPRVRLLLDASNAFAGRYFEAIRFAGLVEKYDIYWFEEPVAPDDYRGHAIVGEATHIPIATGENEYTRYGFRDLITLGKPAILMPDAQFLGGITEFRKVADLAQAYDLPVSPHGSQDVHVHLGAAVPNGLMVEFYRDNVDPLWGRAFVDTLMLNTDGTLSPPQRPGLGIELNEKVLGPYRVE